MPGWSRLIELTVDKRTVKNQCTVDNVQFTVKGKEQVSKSKLTVDEMTRGQLKPVYSLQLC